MPPGSHGTLAIDAVGAPLAFVVKRNEDGVLGGEFALDVSSAQFLGLRSQHA
jgi:hypothetical protein